MNAREAAYLALLASLRQERFVSHSLENWQQQEQPSHVDYGLAQEIAMGACRMALALDYLAAHLACKRTLSVKVKERALLRIALYQFYFMDKVPLYAIASETMKLANKYCHRTFANFLNALLRRLADNKTDLPMGADVTSLSIRYSYPEFFVHLLAAQYPSDVVEAILKAGNEPSKTMVRMRPGWKSKMHPWTETLSFIEAFPSVAVLEDKSSLREVINSKSAYIQNITPAALIADLAAHTTTRPKAILDLCASPGGKLLAAHDAFPEALIFGNDVSEDKLERLRDNFEKYEIAVELSCGNGEDFVSEKSFDLIILDVPCSNSGVLNKRPEARWRLTESSIKTLAETQRRLIDRAVTLLSPEGAIWYLTCSILESENEAMTTQACHKHGLEKVFSKTILPTTDGWDGGHASLLKKRKDEG